MFEDAKSPAKSVTIVSNVLSIAALAAGLAFKEVGPAEQQAIVTTGSTLAAGVLQLLSIWGRVRAKQRIG